MTDDNLATFLRQLSNTDGGNKYNTWYFFVEDDALVMRLRRVRPAPNDQALTIEERLPFNKSGSSELATFLVNFMVQTLDQYEASLTES